MRVARKVRSTIVLGSLVIHSWRRFIHMTCTFFIHKWSLWCRACGVDVEPVTSTSHIVYDLLLKRDTAPLATKLGCSNHILRMRLRRRRLTLGEFVTAARWIGVDTGALFHRLDLELHGEHEVGQLYA